MSSEIKIVKEIQLNGSKKGLISIGELSKPYGENSESVVSIAVSIGGDEIDWKVHIPFENLDAVILALQEVKNLQK